MKKFANNYFEGSDSKCRKFCLHWVEGKAEDTIQLKGNVIAIGLVELERLFDRQDAFLAQNSIPKEVESGKYEKVNIGDNHNPKMINIGSYYEIEEKKRFIKLLTEYIDVFS